MLKGRGADLPKKKTWVLWSQDLMGGSLCPLPYGTQEGNGVATEVRRFQGPWGPTCGAAVASWFWAVRACVGVCARVLRPRVWGPCVCVRCARVCPACVRAWRRRARDPAAVVRARRSARPSAGAQHRLRPRVCMRGVSERVGGPSGVGCGEQRRGHRRSQDALAPGPAPRPRGDAAAGAGRRPLPNSWPRPGGIQEERRGRREEPAGGQAKLRVLPPGCGPRGAAAEGRGPRAGGRRPSRSPENKRRRRRLLRGQNNLRWRRPKAGPRPGSPSP